MKKQKKKVALNTFPKVITVLVVAHGMILTTLSYILAFFGMQTVSDVSMTIVSEIIAPIITYLATNMIMNIFEKNNLSFSTPLQTWSIDEELSDGKGD